MTDTGSATNGPVTVGDPEVGVVVDVGGILTNIHDVPGATADSSAVLLLHGSGPGANAWATWRTTIKALSGTMRVVAPDLLGFGHTGQPSDGIYSATAFVDHIVAVLDKLGLSHVSLVGNSFGGGVALRLAAEHPDRIDRLVLMGSAGVPFTLTPGLAKVWGYRPSASAMKQLVDILAYDSSIVTDDLIELRYQASTRVGVQESYQRIFCEPFQSIIDDLVVDAEEISALRHRTLIIHGRDDVIVPKSNSLRLSELIPNADLHIFGKCGHWTQFEHPEKFHSLLKQFLHGNE